MLTNPALAERVLRALPATCVGDLATRLGVPNADASRALRDLDYEGLVEKRGPERDEDGKAIGRRGRWVLTELGRDVVEGEKG